jgi:hypothetical protein
MTESRHKAELSAESAALAALFRVLVLVLLTGFLADGSDPAGLVPDLAAALVALLIGCF